MRKETDSQSIAGNDQENKTLRPQMLSGAREIVDPSMGLRDWSESASNPISPAPNQFILESTASAGSDQFKRALKPSEMSYGEYYNYIEKLCQIFINQNEQESTSGRSQDSGEDRELWKQREVMALLNKKEKKWKNMHSSERDLTDKLLGIEDGSVNLDDPVIIEKDVRSRLKYLESNAIYQSFLNSLDEWEGQETLQNPDNHQQISQAKKRIIEAKRNSRNKELDLNGLGLKSLPPCIEQLTHLEHLDLCANKLESIPPSLFKLTNLKDLDLSKNQIREVPDLYKLTRLRRLNVSKNNIATMPRLPGDLNSLNGYSVRGISRQKLESIFLLNMNPELALASAPDQALFKQDPKPASKSISTNYLGTEPPSAPFFDGGVGDNQGSKPSVGLGGVQVQNPIEIISSKKNINYTENQTFVDQPMKEIILDISQGIGENQKLSKPIDVMLFEKPKINEFEPIIQSFITLLNQWEEQEKQQNPDNHQQISQAKNRIIEAKRNSRNKELDLNGLGLKSLPPCIEQLTHLEHLDLCANKLESIPPSLFKLTNLKDLDLSKNQIREVPDSIVGLTNLEELSLKHNQIDSLPDLYKLTRLRRLNVSKNNIATMPRLPDDLNSLNGYSVRGISQQNLENIFLLNMNPELALASAPDQALFKQDPKPASKSISTNYLGTEPPSAPFFDGGVGDNQGSKPSARLGVEPSDPSWGKEPSSLPDPSDLRYRESFANHETTYLRSTNNPGIPLSPPAATTGPRSDNAPVSKPTCLASCVIQ